MEVFRLSQNMQSLDFDIHECIRIVLDSLMFAQNYPHSFEREVMLSHETRGVESMSTEDIHVLNRMLRVLYDRVYQGLCAMRLYDATGRCRYEHFSTDHGNIVVWVKPIETPPTS